MRADAKYKAYRRKCYECGKAFDTNSYHSTQVCNNCFIDRQGKYSGNFKEMKKTILIRDKSTCRCCKRNSKQVKIVVHHIDCNKGNNEAANLITLCDQCHLSLHGRYDCKILKRVSITKLFPSKIAHEEFGIRWVDEKKTIFSPIKTLLVQILEKLS